MGHHFYTACCILLHSLSSHVSNAVPASGVSLRKCSSSFCRSFVCQERTAAYVARSMPFLVFLATATRYIWCLCAQEELLKSFSCELSKLRGLPSKPRCIKAPASSFACRVALVCKSLKIIADAQEHGAIAYSHSGAERCHVALGSFYGIDLHLWRSPSAGLIDQSCIMLGSVSVFRVQAPRANIIKHIKKHKPISFCSFGAGYLSVTGHSHGTVYVYRFICIYTVHSYPRVCMI